MNNICCFCEDIVGHSDLYFSVPTDRPLLQPLWTRYWFHEVCYESYCGRGIPETNVLTNGLGTLCGICKEPSLKIKLNSTEIVKNSWVHFRFCFSCWQKETVGNPIFT